MPESKDPRTQWISDVAAECLRVSGVSEADKQARLEALLERRLREIPVALLETLWAERLEAEKTLRLERFNAGVSARLWQQGVAEALRVNSFPPVMGHSRDPERYAIGKDWFESVAGARLYEDLVELRTSTTLARHMLVARVCIEVPRDGAADAAYAVLEGRVLRPYQISPVQQFYPGDTLRKVEDGELSTGELRALAQARVMLQEHM